MCGPIVRGLFRPRAGRGRGGRGLGGGARFLRAGGFTLQQAEYLAREGGRGRVHGARVLLRERREEDAEGARALDLPDRHAAGAGEGRLGGGVDAGAEGALLRGRQRAGELDAPLDGGQIDEALLDQIGQLVGDGFLDLQPLVRAGPLEAEGGLAQLRAEAGEARVRHGRRPVERHPERGRVGAPARGRGDVAERVELDGDVVVAGVLLAHARRLAQAVAHHAEDVAADDGILGEHVLDVVGVHQRVRELDDHVLDRLVDRLVAERAGRLSHERGARLEPRRDGRDLGRHQLVELAGERRGSALDDEDVAVRLERVDDAGREPP